MPDMLQQGQFVTLALDTGLAGEESFPLSRILALYAIVVLPVSIEAAGKGVSLMWSNPTPNLHPSPNPNPNPNLIPGPNPNPNSNPNPNQGSGKFVTRNALKLHSFMELLVLVAFYRANPAVSITAAAAAGAGEGVGEDEDEALGAGVQQVEAPLPGCLQMMLAKHVLKAAKRNEP